VKSSEDKRNGKSRPQRWQQKLIHRPYREARLREEECSARIEHQGGFGYFPLGSADPAVAAAKAQEIYGVIAREGWKAANERFEREITLAIFWSDNPAAVTYTTLFTFLQGPANGPEPAPAKVRRRICVIEPDGSVRSTVGYWLERQPGFRCPGVFGSVREALAKGELDRADLTLVNRGLPELARSLEEIRALRPGMPLFTYRIHEESDQIFICISGITGGYVFRRRPPTELFEPIQAAAQKGTFSAKEVFRHVKEYFSSFFGREVQAPDHSEVLPLTAREQEVLNYVGKGFLDKEIAYALNLSVFTVHNHLKNIYEKLEVHTRTEAVMRYLQK
jgi:DNA-binding NarL/FixJ family response regulator